MCRLMQIVGWMQTDLYKIIVYFMSIIGKCFRQSAVHLKMIDGYKILNFLYASVYRDVIYFSPVASWTAGLGIYFIQLVIKTQNPSYKALFLSEKKKGWVLKCPLVLKFLLHHFE